MSPRERLTNLYESYLKKRPRQSRSRVVVDAVLNAAVDLLARTGDEDVVKVEEIAARAGVGVGSLYDYFPDRDRILLAVLAKVTEQNLLEFERLLADARPLPLRDALARIVDFALDHYLGDLRLTRAYVRVAAANDFAPVLIRSQGVIAQKLATDLAQRADVEVGDHEAAAWLLTNTLMGVIHTLVWEQDGAVDRDRIRTNFIEMVHAYLTRPS